MKHIPKADATAFTVRNYYLLQVSVTQYYEKYSEKTSSIMKLKVFYGDGIFFTQLQTCLHKVVGPRDNLSPVQNGNKLVKLFPGFCLHVFSHLRTKPTVCLTLLFILFIRRTAVWPM